MEKPVVQSADRIHELSRDETVIITGGSLVQALLKFAVWGSGYFFRMGVREGRRTRDQL